MDFDKLAENIPDVDPTDPLALFRSLDKKQSHVDLRKAQVEVLSAWQGRRNERDIVLKLPTGAGKTTVGLLMLYSHMREANQTAMFLCPTNQLVEQVVREGELCGIPCVMFGGDGKHVPPSAVSGDAILVTSIQKLFNARNYVFKRSAFVPHAILLDDAHSALEIIRRQFTIRAGMKDRLYTKLLGLFAPALREQSTGTFESIKANDPMAMLEVPYWAWAQHLSDVSKILAEDAKDEESDTGLVWGMVSTTAQGLRCIISGRGAEIVPEVLPVASVLPYGKAQHRIFMSATVSDESQLVKELDCSPFAAEHPVIPAGAGGLGERMVIVPGLMFGAAGALSRADIAAICKRISSSHAVVVITPSDDAAKVWQAPGVRVVTSDADDVGRAVLDLRSGRTRFAVFSNRYDGLDLPDDACRLLVLDGSPISYSLRESMDGGAMEGVSGLQRILLQRIEQGMGRAVRSPSDYAAVVLWGDDLVNMVANRSLLKVMSDETRLQLELGLAIAKQTKSGVSASSDVEDLALKCILRDAGWKKYYQQKVKVPLKSDDSSERAAKIALAVVERNAWQLFVSNRGNEASDAIGKYLNSANPPDELYAWLLQRSAWYTRHFDLDRSMQVQRAAHDRNHRLLRPPAGVKYSAQAAKASSQGAAVLRWYKGFEHGPGSIATISLLGDKLVFDPNASSEMFEEGLRELGEILGLAGC